MQSTLNTDRTSWDFSSFYNGIDDPQIEADKQKVKQACDDFVQKWESREDYLSDPSVLGQALADYESFKNEFGSFSVGKFNYYLSYMAKLNLEDDSIRAKKGLARDLALEISNKLQFFTHRVSRISPDQQSRFLQAPELQSWKHYLTRLFAESKYLLSEDVEKVINLKSNTAYGNWTGMRGQFIAKESYTITDEDGQSKEKSFEELMSLLSSKQKTVRDEAAQAVNAIFKKHIDMATWELNSVLEYKKVEDELRGYERPDSSTHISDDVETEVIDSLRKAVAARHDLPAKFYQLKAQLLGLHKLGYHERNLEVGTFDKSYSWEESAHLVHSVLDKLDPEFGQIFAQFVNNGQIDVYPKKGKSGGAFCTFGEKQAPILILLNFTNKLRDITTIAHEVGHGINHYLMHKNESALNFGGSIFTAEVASTFMEDFVLEAVAEQMDDDGKLSVMMTKLNDDISSIFRQIACYDCEMELHQEFRANGFLSSDKIGQIFQKHMSAYMGDYVSQDEGSQNWWLYWSHLRYYFYVSSYASGLLISKSMQNMVKQDAGNIQSVKEWFGTGSSVSPKESFARLGISISDPQFWNRGLTEIEALLQQTEDLARKLGKI